MKNNKILSQEEIKKLYAICKKAGGEKTIMLKA